MATAMRRESGRGAALVTLVRSSAPSRRASAQQPEYLRVRGRMPRQMKNDSAACSTSMPQPVDRRAACRDFGH